MKSVPIASAASASGPMWRTRAPRRRRICSSTEMATRKAWRRGELSEAVGSRHSTSVCRRAGAASRLVTLHTPPSTYSRSPIRTGANTQGMAHEAVTASATLARGAPGAPKTTRLPERLSTQHTRRRPSKRAPERSTAACRRASVRPVSGARASRAARAGPPPGAESAVATGASGDVAAHPQRAAVRRRPGVASGSGSPTGAAAGLDRGRRESAAGRARRAGGELAAGQAARDDGARGGPDEGVDVAHVGARLVLDAGEHTGHPRLADHAAAAEHEDVRGGEAWHPAHPSRRPARRARRRTLGAVRAALACLYAIAYVCIVAVQARPAGGRASLSEARPD